jgi:hypothetical protein
MSQSEKSTSRQLGPVPQLQSLASLHALPLHIITLLMAFLALAGHDTTNQQRAVRR